MAHTLSPWSLTDLFPAIDSPALNDTFKQVDNCVAEFEKFRDVLCIWRSLSQRMTTFFNFAAGLNQRK